MDQAFQTQQPGRNSGSLAASRVLAALPCSPYGAQYHSTPV